MLKQLDRVVPPAPNRPEPPPIIEMMQQITREIASGPSGWTAERKQQMASLFDQMAPSWSERASELRGDPLHDALSRGEIPDGLVLEVGSGSGIFTPTLAGRFQRLVAVDLSLEMLRHAAPEHAPRVCADASALPCADGAADVVVLVNCFLFPAEVDRVLSPAGVLVWASTLGAGTPIYLSPQDVTAALPGEWTGVWSEAGWGTWAVVRRAS